MNTVNILWVFSISHLFFLSCFPDSTTYAMKVSDDDLIGDYFLTSQSVTSNNLMNPSRMEAATFVRNKTLYVWGGQSFNTNNPDFFDIVPYFNAISLDITEEQDSVVYSFVNNSRDYKNFAIGTSAAVDPTNNDRVLFFGGYRNIQREQMEDGDMYVEQYDFSNSQWTTIPSVAEDLNGTRIPAPLNRAYSKATTVTSYGNNENIYIVGGIIGDDNATLDDVPIWMYNPTRQVFIPIIQQNITIDDGENEIFPFVLQNNRILYLTTVANTHVHILDTNTNQISIQPVQIQEGVLRDAIMNGSIIQTERYFAFTNLGNADEIIYYSDFYDTRTEHITNHLFSFDITTWTWVPRKLTDLQGGSSRIISQKFLPRYGCSIGVLDDQYVVVAYGLERDFAFNDIRVIRKGTVNGNMLEVLVTLGPNDVNMMKSSFRQIFDHYNSTGDLMLSKGAIAGIVIGGIVAILLSSFVVWRFRRSIKRFIIESYLYLLWDPRTGEPRWTEYSHIGARLILLALFSAYLAYSLNQVINSPIATLSFKPAAENGVMVPDTRLCFQGVSDVNVIYGIKKESGASKKNANVAIQFPSSKFYPYSTYKVQHTGSDCWFISREADALKEGDVMQIEYSYTLDNISTLHSVQIDLYPATAKKNPNEVIYFGDKSLELMPWKEERIEDQDVLSFAHDTKNGRVTNNRYTLDLETSAIITYELQNHQYLANYGWNRVGFAPIYNDTAEAITSLQTDVRELGGQSEDPNIHQSLITLRPSGIVNVTLQDQPVNSLVGILGSVGGLMSLLVAIDSFIFGSRPRSPWGILHRLFPRNHKASFENTLRKKFGFLNRPIPFIHPVHPRFADEYNNLIQRDHGLMVLPTLSPMNNNNQEQKMMLKYENGNDQFNNEKASTTYFDSSYKDIDDINNDIQIISHSPSLPPPLPPTGTATVDIESRIRILEKAVQQANQQTETDRNYIRELERRQQLMELMLKSYYIDPEVFIGLSDSYIEYDKKMIQQSKINSNDSSDDEAVIKDTSKSAAAKYRPTVIHDRFKSLWGKRYRNQRKEHRHLTERSMNNINDQESIDESSNIISNTYQHIVKDNRSDNTERAPLAKDN